MTYILAVDQSIASCGWCVFNDDSLLDRFGIVKTKKVDGDLYTRVESICDTLLSVYKVCPQLGGIVLCREGLAFGGSNSNATRDLAYLVGAIEYAFQSSFEEVAPTSLKKFATGSGKAKKEDMIAALPDDIRGKFMANGYKKTTGLSDLADAYFIGRYFMEYQVVEGDKCK